MPENLIFIIATCTRFKPINFYWLWHMQALTFKTYKNKEKIGIKDSILKLRKTLRTYKIYSSSFLKI